MNKLRNNKYFFLFIFFIALTLLLEHLNISLQSTKPDSDIFTQKLRAKEQILNKTIDSLLHNYRDKDLAQWVNKNNVRLDYLYKEEGLIFFVYKNSDLVYWSSNSIVISQDTTWFKKPFSKLGNTYSAVYNKKQGNIYIVGIVDIMETYPYENKFLRNGFHKSFKTDDAHILVFEDKQSSDAIYNYKNEYLFSLRKELKQVNTVAKTKIMTLLLLLSFVFLLLFGRDKFRNVQFTFLNYGVFALALIAVRVLMQWFGLPSFLYELKLFQPYYFAYSAIFPSLGELLISIILINYLIFVFYAKVNIQTISKNNKPRFIMGVLVWLAFLVLYGWFANGIFKHLIVDSNFQFEAYDVLNLSVSSFVGYFIILVLFNGYILLVDKLCTHLKGAVSITTVLKSIAIVFAVVALVLVSFNNYEGLFSLVCIAIILTYWVYVRYKHNPRFGMVVILIALFSIFSTYFIRKENFTKRNEEAKVIAVNMAREQDPVAEVVLGETIAKIKADSLVKLYLESELFDFEGMSDYIKKNYFTGYLQRYNMQLTVCNMHDSVLLDEHQGLWQHCYNFFNELLQVDGVETGMPGLFYLKDLSGGVNYFMRVPINLSFDWEPVTLFFELTMRPNIQVLGYPELLLEKLVGLYDSGNSFSYAKYENNNLVKRSGDFPYALHREVYGALNEEFFFFQQEKYDHLLFNSQEGHTVIISYPTVHFYNIVISFTYIFFFFLVQTTILLIFGNRFTPIIDFHYNIKNRIVFSMISILLISLFFVGGGTIMYTYNRFEKGQIDLLSEKIQSVLVELEHKFSEYSNIHDIPPDYINSLLVKFSNVFYSDINIYDLSGDLVGTSRREIFDRNLTSTKIHAEAFRELVLNKKARVVHKERIGSMDYYSAYVPFINRQNELLAYLNLPYFTKEVLLRQELLRVVVAVINIYAFLLVVSIVIAVYLSSRLTEPLRMVQQRIKSIHLSSKNERIDYEGQDEIAELVVEYNRMLEELDKSARLLAKSERESAWREMARQIAHEIKNPLTPMKLSIQLLEKSLKNNDDDFKERFERSSRTLIEQIDSLSSIATSFSQFAQMPKTKVEKVDIVERINRSFELFKDCSFVQLETNYDTNNSIFVQADNDKMLQIFNNLMKNAIQSVDNDHEGKVVVNISESNDSVVVEIKDNGVGISTEMEDKLFQPNFTTKTSGMGLGLAIVKNIVEEFGGAIWFDSKPGIGSSFYVSFPLLNITS